MRTAATFAALRLVDHAATLGIPASMSCAWLGLEPAALSAPARLPALQMYKAWSALRDESADWAVAARASTAWTLDTLGLLGFAVSAAPTVGEALATAARFTSLITNDGRLELRTEGELTRAIWHREGAPAGGRALSNEVMLVGFARCFQLLAGTAARTATFRHVLHDRAAHETLMGIELEDRAAEDSIVFSNKTRDQVPPRANPALWRYLTALAERETRPYAAASFAVRVREVIRDSLETHRSAELPVIAKELHLSERTVRRRLEEEGTTFRALALDTRVERARALLEQPGAANIEEIAQDAGYAGASTLGRAFRKKRGLSPSRAKVWPKLSKH
jgi:AraC-like DNA-binding protein